MRIALHSFLHSGQELGYEQAHQVIPDDLLAALRRAGIRDWAIWRDGQDLFHIVDCDDFDSAQRALADDPANQRWQETMSAYVARFAENPEGAAGVALRHVWTLSEQAGS
jgi:L-rhamnose mutarotase